MKSFLLFLLALVFGATADAQRLATLRYASPTEVMTATGSVINYNGAEWVRTAGTITTSTPGYGGVKLPGPAGFHYVRRYEPPVNVKWFGAVGNGSANDSAAVQGAINFVASLGGGDVFSPKGIYRLREVSVPASVVFFGEGRVTKFRMRSTGNAAVDAASYVLRSTGSYSSIHDLRIDADAASGPLGIGNGLLIVPDANGLNRSVYNVSVGALAGYRAGAVGGTFGVSQNYARADISDGAGSHLLIGGNGIVVQASAGSAWELQMDNVHISLCDGIGFDGGNLTDSKLTNMWISGCVNHAFRLMGNNKNVQVQNVKAYLSRLLNPRDPYLTQLQKIIPHETTTDPTAAVVLTGANIQIKSFEVQENGSNGIQLGTATFSLNNSTVDLVADGNGGYDLTQDGATQLAYKRYGILATNYYALNVSGVCDDFRAKYTYPRQLRGIHIAARPSFTAAEQLIIDNWYRIKQIGAGTDFTPYQKGLAATSNAVGTAFQLRNAFPQGPDPAGSFGTGGALEAVNDRLNLNLIVTNQYEMDQGTGTGYDVSADGGNSSFTINGVRVGASQVAGVLTSQGTLPDADNTRTLGSSLRAYQTAFARAFSSNSALSLNTGSSANSLNLTLGGTTVAKWTGGAQGRVTFAWGGSHPDNGRDLVQISGSLTYQFASGSADPTTTQVPASTCVLWKNTTSGAVRLWCNDGGTLKSTLLN